MSDKVFVDTNILVYCWNDDQPEKQNRAEDLLSSGQAVLSWQVIQEFCNVARNKFQPAIPIPVLDQYVTGFLDPICAVYPSRGLWSQALQIHASTQYAFYDALIVASAIASGACILFSEDLQHGRHVDRLEIRNPFLGP